MKLGIGSVICHLDKPPAPPYRLQFTLPYPSPPSSQQPLLHSTSQLTKHFAFLLLAICLTPGSLAQPQFRDEEAEAQRASGTCSRGHRSSGCRIKVSNLKSSGFFQKAMRPLMFYSSWSHHRASDGPIFPSDSGVTIQITRGCLADWSRLQFSKVNSTHRERSPSVTPSSSG